MRNIICIFSCEMSNIEGGLNFCLGYIDFVIVFGLESFLFSWFGNFEIGLNLCMVFSVGY